jgi:hypothetical protein
MNNDDRIVKILEDLQVGQKALNGKIDTLEQGQKALQTDVASVKDVQQKQGKHIDMLVDTAGHMNTALKAVATKHDVEVAVDSAKNELKADILMLDSKVAKKIQSHERRITNFEDQTGIENPEKH